MIVHDRPTARCNLNGAPVREVPTPAETEENLPR